jgi:hypothetical protein
MARRLLILGVLSVLIPACGGGGGDGGSTSAANGSVAYSDAAIETFPSEGSTHVPVGTVVDYHTDPPTSGNHYPDPQPGGYYTAPVASGFLVHSMEHGGVIIYYDASRLTADNLLALQALAAQHPGTFSQVVVVPRTDPANAIILTAWTHRLQLAAYDQTRIEGFMTLFLGNGPEKD